MIKMINVSLFSSFVLISNCALVDLVVANTVPPYEIEPLPDLYALGSTYPASSVNYNASPNPQFASNNFNEQLPPTPNPIVGNYQNVDYQQKPTPNPNVGNYQNVDYQYKPTPNPMEYQHKPTPNPMAENYQNVDYAPKPLESYLPDSKMFDFGSDLKSTLVTMKDNLGLMADTQRMIVNSLKVQQEHYNDIEDKFRADELPSQRHYEIQPNQQPIQYQPIQSNPQPIQYQSIQSNPQPIQYQSIPPLPPLPPLPYGKETIPKKEHKKKVHHHHHKKPSQGKFLITKLIKKKKPEIVRRLPLLGRDTGPTRMEQRAELALRFIRNGIANALWTALIVAYVKLVPVVLFGFKLLFQSIVPLTGMALFRNNQGVFRKDVRDLRDDFDHEDDKIVVQKEVISDDDDDDDDKDSRDDISDSSEATD